MTPDHSDRSSRVTLLLIALGAIAGAVAAIPITILGKSMTGAPPATLANYLWNVGVFGAMGAIGAPSLTWSTLRRVPLWRAIGEPALGAVVGAAIALVTGAPIAFLLLMPAGIVAAAGRLNHVYREPGDTLIRSGDEVPSDNGLVTHDE